MKAKKSLLILVMLSVVFALKPSQSLAQSHPLYVSLGPANAALYTPDSGGAHVAVLAIHRTANFQSYFVCPELARRGFACLGISTRFDNNESQVIFEQLALDVKAGITFLRSLPGITTVLLWGHSGGGPTTSFYQAVAENGPSFCTDPNKLTQCDNSNGAFNRLPPADGIIFVDAHPGVGIIGMLRSNDPAVIDEARPNVVRPELDPFNPANGYNPNGQSSYSDQFKTRYFAAQAFRLNKLIDQAFARLDVIERGAGVFTDNGPVVIGASTSAKLFDLDTSILCCTVSPQKLLQNDGTIVKGIVHSVRLPHPEDKQLNSTFDTGGRLLTLKSFLTANSVRATNSLDGIDYCSSNDATDCNVRQISVPLLVTAMGAYYFITDSEIHYNLAKSADKDFVVIAGLLHGIVPCNTCAGGPYDHSQQNFFDYVTAWINARF